MEDCAIVFLNPKEMTVNSMEAIFAKIAEETSKFQLGDEEVREIYVGYSDLQIC